MAIVLSKLIAIQELVMSMKIVTIAIKDFEVGIRTKKFQII